MSLFSDSELLFLHEPVRLQLMLSLASVRQSDFVFLLNSTGISKGNLSVQMTRLGEKGLVDIEKIIRNNRACTVYQLTKSGRKALHRYKQTMLSVLSACPA
jgi:DNA-binding MarR family transcriptional regulator